MSIRYVKDRLNGDYIDIYVGDENLEPVIEWLRRAGFGVQRMAGACVRLRPSPFRDAHADD